MGLRYQDVLRIFLFSFNYDLNERGVFIVIDFDIMNIIIIIIVIIDFRITIRFDVIIDKFKNSRM